MNVRLKKEIREILPTLVLSILLVGLPPLFWASQSQGFSFVALVIGSAALGGVTFGSEFQRRTFSLLLAQPVPRSVLWNEKMMVLGGSLAAITACALTLQIPVFHSAADDVLALVLIPLCCFAGAPLLTLLARNGIAGGVFGITLPCGLVAIIVTVTTRLSFLEERVGAVVVGMLLVYCCTAYWLGYAFFHRFQAEEGRGRELNLPAGLQKRLARIGGLIPVRPATPMVALLRKEMRLQQINFLLAGVFVLVALAGAFVAWARPENRQWAEYILAPDFFLYVCVLPLVVGAVAFAEERNWGLYEWQLTLPPSVRKQWAAKLVTTLPASFLLGVLLPGLLWLAGWRLFAEPGGKIPALASEWLSPRWCGICLGQLLLMSMAGYAGSWNSSTLKAILFPIAMVLLGLIVVKLVLLIVAAGSGGGPEFAEAPGFSPWHFVNLCLIVLLCLFQWLSYRNFRHTDISYKAIVGQSALLLIAFVAMVVVFTTRYCE
jgi:hypothetical protein